MPDTDEEDRAAFRYGVQIANEQIMRVLIEGLLGAAGGNRDTLAAQMRAVIEKSIAVRLAAAAVPDGIEAESARGIVASVFDGLASEPLPPASAA